MMFNYIIDHVPTSYTNIRTGRDLETVKYITIHSTANPSSTAQNERKWLVNPDNHREASYHLVVDEKDVIECVPLHEVTWHCGKAAGNANSISIEMCESGDRRTVLYNTIALVKKLMKTYLIDVRNVVTHNYWNGKNCPRILIDTAFSDRFTWNWFKTMVETAGTPIWLDDKEVNFIDTMLIEGYNWVKVRDILELLDYTTEYHAPSNGIVGRKYND